MSQQFISFLCLLAGHEVDTSELKWRDETRKWNSKRNCPDGPPHCYFSGDAYTNCVRFRHDVKVCNNGQSGATTEWFKLWPTFHNKTIVVANFGLHLKLDPSTDWFQRVLAARDNSDAHIVWLQTTQQHFDSRDGSHELSANKQCSDRKLDLKSSPRFQRDGRILAFFENNGFPVLRLNGYDNTSSTHVIHQDRTDEASGLQDCTHFCVPGLPDHFNRLLYNYLMNQAKRMDGTVGLSGGS